MIKTGYYIDKSDKLVKKLKKTLRRYDRRLSARQGKEFSKTVQQKALAHFEELIPTIPFYNAASYQEIILLNAQLIAIVRAMKDQGQTVEDTMRIQVELLREDWAKIPRFAGRIFTSRLGGFF